MLHVVDNLLPSDRLDALKQLCEAHDALKQNHPGDALFSWRPDQGRCRSVHRPEHLQLMEAYLTDHLLPVATPFSAGHCGVEWWCNTNNDLDWHIDKDEAEGRTSGSYVLPLLSTVF